MLQQSKALNILAESANKDDFDLIEWADAAIRDDNVSISPSEVIDAIGLIVGKHGLAMSRHCSLWHIQVSFTRDGWDQTLHLFKIGYFQDLAEELAATTEDGD